MGTLSSLLSDPLVKGFTTAAAIHVIVSQLKDMLGVKIPLYKGAFNIIHTLVDIVRYAKNANLVALGVSFFVILILLAMNDYLKVFFNQPIFLKKSIFLSYFQPYLFEKYKFPLPSELIVVVGGVLVSKYVDLGVYGVSLIGQIPTG
jgi:solute carrier family 26, other